MGSNGMNAWVGGDHTHTQQGRVDVDDGLAFVDSSVDVVRPEIRPGRSKHQTSTWAFLLIASLIAAKLEKGKRKHATFVVFK